MTVIKPILHHVTLKTSRLSEMVAWYRTVLGAQVQFANAENAWLTNDAANHRIAFLSAPGLSDDPERNRHNGLHHSAYEYASFADQMASYARLKGEGILPAFALEHGMTVSLYYRDPEGNHVELQSDNFGDWAASGEWMRTHPDFAENPIGVFFDPETVYAAFAQGRSFQELQPAIRAGAFAPATIPGIGLPEPGEGDTAPEAI